MDSLKNILKAVFATDEAKAASVKTASGAAIAGLTLNEWVAVITFIYFVLQVFFMIRRELGKDKCHECKK